MAERAREDPPRKRKRPAPVANTGSFDIVRALTAVGAALALFIVAYGFGLGTRWLRTSLAARAVASAPNSSEGGAAVDMGSKETAALPPAPRARPGRNPNSMTPPNSADVGVARPPASPGDRNNVKTIDIKPSPTWTIPEENIPPTEALLSALDVARGDVCFAAASTGQAAVLSLQKTSLSRLAILWRRYDLRTGKQLGDAIELWPWFKGAEDATLNAPPLSWALASLSADGNRLALRDPATPGRLDVWDTSGARLLSLIPNAPASAVEWLGWSADGRLLTVGEGRLTAWDIPEGRAVYEAAISGSTLAAVLSPERTWVAVATKGGLFLFDTAAGRCLGRLDAGDPEAEGWMGLAVAPDGRRLCGITRRRPPTFAPGGVYGWMTRWNGKERAGEMVWSSQYDIDTWNLQSGKRVGATSVWTDMASPRWNTLHWCGPKHILVGGRNLIDLEHHVLRYAYLTPRTVVPESPDGRLWYLEEGKSATLRAYRCPNPDAGEVVLQPGMPIEIKTECGTAERDKRTASALRAVLESEGYKDVPGGWTVHVKTETFDTRERLPQDPADGPTLPAVLVKIRLVAPDGTEAGVEEYSAVFQRKRSKYFVQPRAGASDVEQYNFAGKERNQAILDEIWDQLALPGGWTRWPRAVAKVQDKLLLLPQVSELVPD